MTSIAGILFDKDGVIVDFDKTWAPALKAIAHELAGGDGQTAAEYLRLAGYDAQRDLFLPGSVWAAGNTRDLVDVWVPNGSHEERIAMVRRVDGYCASCVAEPLMPLDELTGLFERLKKRGLAIGIATNDSEASARRTMENFGLNPLFDLIIGYDSVESPKPAPDPVHLFARHTGLDVGALAMVGDNRHDAEMARAAGTGLAIGVLSGNSTHDDLAPLTDHIIGSIAELEALLDRLDA